MRVLIIVLLGIACGCGLGLATSWARYGRGAVDELAPVSIIGADQRLKPPSENEPQPRLVLEEENFDFGDLQLGSETHHDFHVSNVGDAPLHLTSGGTSCAKCTIDKLPKADLAPGESEEITITYHAQARGSFRQTATILTNDPLHPRVSLVVSGKVVTMLRLSPTDVVFSRLVAGESATADVRLLCYSKKPLEITGHEFTESDTAKLFQLKVDPLPQEELTKEEAASGALLHVTALAGLPAGAVRQKLILQTNQDISPTLDLPIQGRVDGEISVVGAGWDSEQGIISLGAVKGAEGARRQVFLLVRGPERHSVKIHAGQSDPQWLRIELGEPQDVSDGAVVKIPLNVVIPPGSPAANHMGNVQGKLARLTLETTLPTTPQLQVYVQFFVEN